MIYLFTGNSDFLINDSVSKWKNQFISKYGDFNMIHLKDIDSLDNNFLAENLLASSFLSEKKLIILKVENDISDEKIVFLENSLKNVPEDNIILFYFINPDKRSKIYKFLSTNAQVKDFSSNGENDNINLIKSKYNNKIDNESIHLLLKYKNNNINKTISEIEKLLITNDQINTKIIKENIIPELEESIFELIDNIMNLEIHNSLKNIDIILCYTNIYSFYNNLLANLRVNVFILKLKKERVNNNDIGKILNLGNRSFLINKNYTIGFDKLSILYENLINIDKKMKTGFLLGSDDNDFRIEIEKALLNLKKDNLG